MTTRKENTGDAEPAPCSLMTADGASPIVLVCEHASNRIPAEFGTLGLTDDIRASHIAWDPGAFEVAANLSRLLDARLVHSTISRLVFDCNRPPEAPDSIPSKSEVYEIPGNCNLDRDARRRRAEIAYWPFQDLLTRTLADRPDPVLVTIHSFTPVYFGAFRAIELGILHDADSRLADEMLKLSAANLPGRVERNQPYGPADGVTHTLKEHALKKGRLNVMLEIRNDLIATAQQQAAVARAIAGTLVAALSNLGIAHPRKAVV